jgi:octaprenyl-diphosphate synthase
VKTDKNKTESLEKMMIKEIHFIVHKLKLPKNLLSFILEGKRIRAKIIDSSLQPETPQILRNKLTSSIELTHASSLLHDDIVDESELRRGHHTAFFLLPTSGASSIGYLMFSRIFLQMIRLKPFIYKHYFRTLKEMCIGQIMEIDTLQRKNHSIKKYMQTIHFKTGSLFAFCFGISGNRWDNHCSKLGYRFGTTFQIIDDLNDIMLDETKTGKPFMQDIKRGIVTLPFLLAESFIINQKAIEDTKKIAHELIKNIDLSSFPIAWQEQFLELIKQINQVTCNTCLVNKYSNKDYRSSVQTSE